ncbi:DUF3576 domain-containing protein [Alphaproteobacteria bacterium]|nr:DUF3576 domain-containing protein [Alphaproteobacteria bacterium]
MLKLLIFFVLVSSFLVGCNRNLSEEERKEMWGKAQTQGEIIRRSGTPFNLATDPDLALSDAQNRLRTGGGLIGNKANFSFLDGEDATNNQTTSLGMPINPYLWKASIETINFMPLSSTDPFAGTIITDWYTTKNNLGERCKLNVFINGKNLKTKNLKVLSFCQSLKNNQWVNVPTNTEENIKLENAILNKAKKLKLSSG